ncbi:hypothetical protein F5Y15DRAFT_393359 [Xylariaceae sp. FL0016]|nr:hypothetical protein F5Y15DRAFT_393359 [Xylariaceae sp. FL0016]
MKNRRTARDVGGMMKQRSRTGCRTCRSRKVKCDEKPGGCSNCERLSLPCSNGLSHPLDPVIPKCHQDVARPLAGPRRSRTYRSCRACRGSKTRCSGERPTCLRCRQKSLDCEYDGKSQPSWIAALSQEKTSSHASKSLSPAGEQAMQQHPTPSSTATKTGRPSQEWSASGMGESDEASIGSEPCTGAQCPNHLKWLLLPDLPDKTKIQLLVSEYFDCMHSLRSFGFIHKSSYMQALDDDSKPGKPHDVLLHVLCALGAKFYVAKLGDSMSLSAEFGLRAGTQWARTAQSMLFADMNSVSVLNTMAVVLLHEHELRVGNYASAFTLTGMGVRLAQALQINLESSADIVGGSDKLPWSAREARRRLMWSVYTMDSWVGSGVDELTLINEKDIRIQLPCNEQNFTVQMPCIVETLQPGTYLPFVSSEARAIGPIDRLDLQAQFVRLLSVRTKVLRFVKHLDTAQQPWVPGSEFSRLEKSLHFWYDGLTDSLCFTQMAIRKRKASSQLGALLLLHIMYHQTLCDLHRIGMHDLFKIRVPVDFPVEQTSFLEQVQDCCFQDAVSLASVFEEALRHGAEVLADTWLSIVAHDSSRVIIHYISKRLGTSRHQEHTIKQRAVACVHTNIQALDKMVPMYQLAKPLHASTSLMLKRAGIDLPDVVIPPSGRGSIIQDTDTPATLEPPLQFSPEYILNPLAIYRMARRDIQDQEKNAPEKNPTRPHGARSAISPPTRTVHKPSAPAALRPPSDITPPRTDAHDEAPAPDPPPWAHPPALGCAGMDAFQLPTSFDNLQAYFPLMLNNFNLPSQAPPYPTGHVAGGGHAAPFGGFAAFDLQHSVMGTGTPYMSSQHMTSYASPIDQGASWAV